MGHRIIEIGCVELVNRRPTGRHFHHYLDPERDIDEGATAVHGITRAKLQGKPRFADIAQEFVDFVSGAELVIHNAPFDVAFLDAELARLGGEQGKIDNLCAVLDTLMMAREIHPGQRNSLDALCKRYGIDNSHREWHGALLDARILADVYLAMTGGQSALELNDGARSEGRAAVSVRFERPAGVLPVIVASAEELAAHESLMAKVKRAS